MSFDWTDRRIDRAARDIAHHFVEGLTKTLHPRNKSAKEKNLL